MIFNSALYNPDLYGQNQKAKRPYNWVLINTKDENGKNRTVLLEVNPHKDNVEIVHGYFVNDKNLELIKKQAIREGDQILILPSEQSEEVGGLSFMDGHDDKLRFSLRQSYDDRLADWKKRNGFAPDEKPMDKPVRGQNESIGDFMVRMADYATDDEYRKARDQYKQEMDKWKGAPKASDYDLSVDLDGMAGKLTAIASAMLNQRSFDRQTIDGITDMVKTMLALGWGDRMTRGKIGNQQ